MVLAGWGGCRAYCGTAMPAPGRPPSLPVIPGLLLLPRPAVQHRSPAAHPRAPPARPRSAQLLCAQRPAAPGAHLPHCILLRLGRRKRRELCKPGVDAARLDQPPPDALRHQQLLAYKWARQSSAGAGLRDARDVWHACPSMAGPACPVDDGVLQLVCSPRPQADATAQPAAPAAARSPTSLRAGWIMQAASMAAIFFCAKPDAAQKQNGRPQPAGTRWQQRGPAQQAKQAQHTQQAPACAASALMASPRRLAGHVGAPHLRRSAAGRAALWCPGTSCPGPGRSPLRCSHSAAPARAAASAPCRRANKSRPARQVREAPCTAWADAGQAGAVAACLPAWRHRGCDMHRQLTSRGCRCRCRGSLRAAPPAVGCAASTAGRQAGHSGVTGETTSAATGLPRFCRPGQAGGWAARRRLCTWKNRSMVHESMSRSSSVTMT